jgi:hypothetical protein
MRREELLTVSCREGKCLVDLSTYARSRQSSLLVQCVLIYLMMSWNQVVAGKDVKRSLQSLADRLEHLDLRCCDAQKEKESKMIHNVTTLLATAIKIRRSELGLF